MQNKTQDIIKSKKYIDLTDAHCDLCGGEGWIDEGTHDNIITVKCLCKKEAEREAREEEDIQRGFCWGRGK